ncbi:MAG TPA: DUF177 domain-containing protein [Candidatus Binataceae bacterium]|nr:DUF177 domain-containing protein [Candidatus Binataceae bacterium]
MKLRIDDITADAREFRFAEPESEINRALASGLVHEYTVKSPVRVSISCYRAGTDVFVTGSAEATAAAACSRCAEDFEGAKHRAFRYVLAPKVIGEGKDAALRVEDLEFSVYEGEEIDLSPLIREQVLLALTERPLCREECRGLCPHCGANLNEQDCGCTAAAFDPRLAVLRNLKVSR